MSDQSFQIGIDAWDHGAPIPKRYAFGQPGDDGPFAPSDNVSPAIRWEHPPMGTKSFALIVHDEDVPSLPDDVNQFGREIPPDLPRVPFFHWVLVHIDPSVTEIAEGAGGSGIVAKGKPIGPTPLGLTGYNDYTGWFASDPDMAGTYGGYDGPCPPWNDSVLHHYQYTLYALDVAELELEERFGGSDVMRAMEGHILAESSHMGTYAMNPRLG